MTSKKTILVNYAVKEELIAISADGFDIQYLHTGVGKTKSAGILTKIIYEDKPDFVLNVGTAGTQKHNVGDIFVSTAFIDRDYEAMKLPGLTWEINGMDLLGNELPLKLNGTIPQNRHLQYWRLLYHSSELYQRRCNRYGGLRPGFCMP